MPDIEQIIDFLDRRDSLALGESPWQPAPDDSDIYELDWDVLFENEDDGEEFRSNDQNDGWSGYDRLVDTFLKRVARRPGPDEGKDAPVIESTSHYCAWYQPIHFFGPDFGIFIRQECAIKWAKWVARFLPGSIALSHRVCRQLLRAGVYILFLHEHYHHKVESLGLRLHVATGKSCYLPYQTKVYRPAIGSDDQLEEALANADAFMRLSEPRYRSSISSPVVKALKEYLRWSFPYNPPGYRRATAYLTDFPFDCGEDVLQERVRLASLATVDEDDWGCAPQMTRSILTVRQPIWWLVPRGSRPIVPVTSSPIRTCSSDQLIKLCESRGYEKVSGGKGSHVKLKKPNSPMVIVPGDRNNVSPGTARSTLKALGIQSLAVLPELVKRL